MKELNRIEMPFLGQRSAAKLRLVALLIVTIPLAVVLLARADLGRTVLEPDPYLQDQRMALRPEHRPSVDTLAGAPRYKLDVSIDPESGHYDGRAEIRLTNNRQSCLPRLSLRLYANANAIYGGQLRIQDLKVNGQAIPHQELGPTDILVSLEDCLEPGSELELTTDFSGQAPSPNRGYGILAHSDRGLALSGWYPMLGLPLDMNRQAKVPLVGDLLYAQTGFITASIHLPEGYVPIGTGIESQASPTSEWNITTGPARELALIVLEHPTVETRDVDGVELRYVSADLEQAAVDSETAADMAASVFRTYQNQFGGYPYRHIDVVEWPITIGGYEFPGMVFVDDSLRRADTSDDLEFLLAHELAHQWWFGMVGSDPVEEPWLDEAMANYSTIRYLQAEHGAQAGQALLQDWRQQYGERRPEDPPVDSPSTAFGGWDAYRRTVYIHGAFFLDALEQEMGTTAFKGFLDDYLSAYRYDLANTAGFLELAQQNSPTDLTPLFEAGLSGNIP